MPTALSILVFVASPLDYARYRHTALYFEFEEGAQQGSDSSTDVKIRERGYLEKRTTGKDTDAPTATVPDQSKRGPVPESTSASTDNIRDDSGFPKTTTNTTVKSSIMEVIGSPGFFTFSERLNLGVPTSANLARIIPVSKIPSSIPSSSIRDTISQTTILNGDGNRDWNSQNWVGDALGRMVKAGYLNEEETERGIDEMVDAILEAKDEELSRN